MTRELNLRHKSALRTQWNSQDTYLNTRRFKLSFSVIFYFITQKFTTYFFNLGIGQFTFRDKLRVSK